MFNFIDYRNATYQGSTQDGKPHGLGILIDSQLTFLLAEFREGEIDGPVFIVYADCKIFCGRIKNKKLSGLCCFYIKDKMHIYMNYSQSKVNNKNLIAVLPFCKVILQVDNSQQQHPKVKKYDNYGGKGGDLNQILEKLFDKYYELDEYSSWQKFLIINFIEPHNKKLYWRPTSQEKYNESFFCIKNGGLGIKILIFHDEQFANKIQGSPFIVSAIGIFNKEQVLSGYGQRLIDFQFFAKVEEGVFNLNQKQTVQYLRKNRSNQAKNFFNKNQLKAVDFENYFYNLSYIYNLQKIYSKLNVSLVQETHKIALVTINRPNHSPIELAEIDRRQRKRTQATPTPKYSPHKKNQVMGHQRSSLHKEQSTYFQNDGKQLIAQKKSIDKLNESGSMSEAKKSIQGSVQKIKRINPQTRIKAIKKYQQMFMGNKKGELTDSLQKKSLVKNQEVKYEKPLKPKFQNNYRHIDISTRNLQETYKYKPKYDYQRKNQLDQFITGRKKNLFTPTKYQLFEQRKQDIRLRPYRDNSFYSIKLPKDNQQFFTFTRSNTDLQIPNRDLPSYKETTLEKRSIVQKQPFSRQKQPYYKNIFEDDVYSKYENRITQKQQQLKYFDQIFQIQNNNDSPPKIKRQMNTTKFKRQEPPLMKRQNDKMVSPLAFKNKTPGKIKIVGKKKEEDNFY